MRGGKIESEKESVGKKRNRVAHELVTEKVIGSANGHNMQKKKIKGVYVFVMVTEQSLIVMCLSIVVTQRFPSPLFFALSFLSLSVSLISFSRSPLLFSFFACSLSRLSLSSFSLFFCPLVPYAGCGNSCPPYLRISVPAFRFVRCLFKQVLYENSTQPLSTILTACHWYVEVCFLSYSEQRALLYIMTYYYSSTSFAPSLTSW